MARKPAFYWWVVGFGAALVLCYAAAGIEFWRHARDGKDYGWYRTLNHGSWHVTFVASGGPADGVLRPGDRILKFEGRQGPDWFVNRLVMLVPPGGTLHLTIQRDGQRLDVAHPVPRVPIPVDWGIPLMFGASLVCFGVSMLMGLSKPGARTVQFGSFALLALAAFQLMRSLEFVYWSMDGWARVMFGLLSLSDPVAIAAGYLFAERFPKNIPAGRGWRIVGVAMCTLLAFEWIFVLPDRAVSALNAGWTAWSVRWLDGPLIALGKVPVTFWKIDHLLMTAAIAAVLVRNYRVLQQADLRRRVRWLVFGVVVALVPESVLYLGAATHSLTGFGFRMDTLWFMRFEHLSTAFLGVVASSAVAYSVLQHRVMDIHVVVRRSIQYLFAKRVLQAAISLPVLLLAMRVILNPQLTVRGLLFGSYFYVAVAAAGALGLVYRRSLLLAVDRRFFREEYNQEQILRTLIEEIKDRDSISEMSRLVSEKVEAALHPQRILVFYRHEARGDFTLGHSSSGAEPELRVTAGCPVLRILQDSTSPRDFPFSASDNLPSAEVEYFEKLGIRLLAPVTGAERRLVGILMLGEKRSESPYTDTDRNLLQAIAGQIGVVYENIALRESAKREAQIKRNVLAHLDGAEIDLLKECPRCGTCFDRAAEQCMNDGSALTLTLPVDRTIDGVYRLDRRIGTGAMGAVYRATDLRLGRTVAVKLMVGSLFGNRSAIRRFEREARAAARLSHPNIVAIHDFGAAGTDGAYLVMEMVEGQTLRTELRRAGRLEPAVAAVRFDQLMEGLSAAHDKGVVHRDLKPENLVIARLTGGAELVKILDFGLAKTTTGDASDHSSLTIAGTVVGTMGYMSPEQLLGQEVDERTDTFAVGVLVMECLTGRRPFAGLSFQELLHATLHQPACLPGDGPAVQRLNAALERCLAKDRENRPRVADIRQELVEAIRLCPSMPGGPSAATEESTIDASRTLS